MTTAALNIKITEVEIKMPYNAKYITTPKLNKFVGRIFHKKLKQANLAVNSDVNAISHCANKSKEKTEKNYKRLI